MTPAQATSTTRAPDTGSAPPLEDLTTRANVHDLVVDFYREIVFDELLEAAKVCSLGQISSALYEVGGQYRRSM